MYKYTINNRTQLMNEFIYVRFVGCTKQHQTEQKKKQIFTNDSIPES